MKTIRIELKQDGQALNLTRQFSENLVKLDEISSTITCNILDVFKTAKQYGIKTGFNFSKPFELNIHSEGQSLQFEKSIFAELGLKGFTVINTDKSMNKLATFIGKLVQDLALKGETDEIFTPEDVVSMAKKVLAA